MNASSTGTPARSSHQALSQRFPILDRQANGLALDLKQLGTHIVLLLNTNSVTQPIAEGLQISHSPVTWLSSPSSERVVVGPPDRIMASKISNHVVFPCGNVLWTNYITNGF